MRIRCNVCGEPVSTEVPEGTLVRAWIECPECIEGDKAARLFEKINAEAIGRLNDDLADHERTVRSQDCPVGDDGETEGVF